MNNNRISYEDACNKIIAKQCEPLFLENEWIGVRKNKKLIKYWFKDKNRHKFYRDYDSVVNGNKIYCNECAKQNQINKQKLSESEYNEYISDFKQIKNIEIITKYTEYKNIKQKLECKCLICNKIFKESITNISRKESHGCETMSKGEKITMSMFEANGIDYKYQVYINELNVTSDFEIKLTNGNIIHLEIDGDQHYDYPNEFHKTYEEFLKAKERDIKKDNWYLSKGYKNMHIRYNTGGKKNDDIEGILIDVINNKYGECALKEININFNINEVVRKSTKNKKIIAYTLDGNFYGVYDNVLQAEEELKVDNSCISECINEKRNIKRAGNYIFKLYEENYPLNITPYKRKSSKPVLVYKNCILIEEIESLNELERKYRVPKSSLSRYLNGKGNNPSKNYDFKYKTA